MNLIESKTAGENIGSANSFQLHLKLKHNQNLERFIIA